MKRVLLTFALLVVALVSAQAGEPRLDKSNKFAYDLPTGWKVVSSLSEGHDAIVLPAEDGKNRNILISDQTGANTLDELKKLYERDLAKGLQNFQLISSQLTELASKRPAVRIIHTNTTPGIPVRQINYVLDVGGQRYFVACTVLKEDDDKYDEIFADFVTSMAEPGK